MWHSDSAIAIGVARHQHPTEIVAGPSRPRRREDVATGELAGHTIQEQTRQSLRNCQAILRAGGAELSDAVMVHTLLLRPEDADGVMEVFDEFFPDVRPPRCVSKLGVDRPGILVSIAMVAVTG